jgi:hypothetical protein
VVFTSCIFIFKNANIQVGRGAIVAACAVASGNLCMLTSCLCCKLTYQAVRGVGGSVVQASRSSALCTQHFRLTACPPAVVRCMCRASCCCRSCRCSTCLRAGAATRTAAGWSTRHCGWHMRLHAQRLIHWCTHQRACSHMHRGGSSKWERHGCGGACQHM